VWTQAAEPTASDGAAGDWLGSVALSADTAVVGASRHDVGGNDNQGSAYAFVLDGDAPVTTATLTPAANARGWNKTAVTVSLLASDALSGVASTEYRRGGAAWTPYAASFSIAAQGVTVCNYRSTDLAGNVEATKTLTVRIDRRKPATKAYGATARTGKKVKLAYRVNDPLPGCARARVALKIFKGRKLARTLRPAGTCACNAKRFYPWRCNLDSGVYAIRVYATDIAGNAQRRVGKAKLIVL
jgi:hypothetical protein